MHRLISFCFALIILLASMAPASAETGNTLFQLSTMSALKAGVYEGAMTIEDLGKHGDFGLGTFEALDGEMVVMNGRFYQVKPDGRAETVMATQTSPFAQLTFFEPETTMTLDNVANMQALLDGIQAGLPSANYPYAIKITGEFSVVKCRSVPAQTAPYQPLEEVLTKQQKIFSFEKSAGVMIGFFGPESLQGIGVPGFHFHYLTADSEGGGHVLDVSGKSLFIEIDRMDSFTSIFPQNNAFAERPALKTVKNATE